VLNALLRKSKVLTTSFVCYQLAFGFLLMSNYPIRNQVRIESTFSSGLSAEPRVPVKGKRALLIGVWDYDRHRGTKLDWWDLHSKRDIDVMGKELETDYGFADSDIKPLTKREETTHAAIIDALKQLIKDTNEGDIVYFQFSGHGQQIPDPTEVGGYSESLIPSDYISREDSSNNIRNKDLRDLVMQLKDKKPANVTLVFDSCYSGNLVRGGRHLVRGSKWLGAPIVGPDINRFAPPAPQTQAVTLKEKDATGIFYEGEAKGLGYVVISASRYDEVAQETDDDLGSSASNDQVSADSEIGLLTYAMAKALAEAKPAEPSNTQRSQPPLESQSTYRDLFERITDLMSQRQQNQTPAIAGDQDRVVLGGVALPAEPFYLVNNDKGELVLNGGTLHGVTVGSVFALYPPGTKHPEQAQPRAVATITSVQLAVSKLDLTGSYRGKVSITVLDRTRAYEQEHAFGDSGLLVNLNDEGFPPDVSAKLRKLSVVRQLVGSDDKWEVRIRPRNAADDKRSSLSPSIRWLVEREDGSTMAALAEDEKLYTSIRHALEAEARWRAIKNLTSRGEQSPVKVSLRLVPVQVNTTVGGAEIQPNQIGSDLPREVDSAGQLVLRDQGYVQFEVLNSGSAPAWVTILDLSNSGKIHPIYPVACENRPIPPNATWTRLPWCAIAQTSNPSDRVELFKLIATTDPVDLSSLADPDAAKGAPLTQGRLSPLAELLRAATLGQKSSGNEAVNPKFWYTDTIPFIVGPKQ
jgi:hypothetical protein